MERMDIFYHVLCELANYHLDDLDEYEEAIKCTEFLMARSDDITREEINKCLFNRYEDYLY